ncbi:HAMP domain-containing protein [Duganella sp. FT92W]|uniref:HAMP domain-containing protein n=1 Tax=Pseudoduganella rivuli TaxID=2666085 RepID=A0A7X2ILQ4_9BURK|nr:sensor histidine kinase [Pseudoduganella rivuli]MRV72058.1 HAMP domain-containing protein [Pseudoduganella rivuli]
MDLRRRLTGSLGLLLGCLMAVATVIQFYSLRADIDAEISASARMVNVLLAADSTGSGAMAALLPDTGIRHLRIRTAGQPAVQPEPHPLLAWLGLAPPPQDEREIRIGGQTLYIAPHPGSEISERWRDTVRIWYTLLFFSGTTLLVVWWAADRALRPVRALEEGLHRLARGETDPALPPFALREFRQVAGAIERLATALAESRAAQHALARDLISVQENERKALARELHDDMGQTLTALNATAAHLARNAGKLAPGEVAECANDMRRDIRASGEQLRAMLKSLRPHGLHASGLERAVAELVDSWQGRGTGIAFTTSLQPTVVEVAEMTALTLYRVVQEAVTNVVRHSRASHCTVELSCTDEQVRVAVTDDGAGLPAAPGAWRGGLLGMRERVEMAGGALSLLPNCGGGLRLVAVLPAGGVLA